MMTMVISIYPEPWGSDYLDLDHAGVGVGVGVAAGRSRVVRVRGCVRGRAKCDHFLTPHT